MRRKVTQGRSPLLKKEDEEDLIYERKRNALLNNYKELLSSIKEPLPYTSIIENNPDLEKSVLEELKEFNIM